MSNLYVEAGETLSVDSEQLDLVDLMTFNVRPRPNFNKITTFTPAPIKTTTEMTKTSQKTETPTTLTSPANPTTTTSEKTTTIPEKTTTISEKTTTISEKTTTIPEKTTTISEKTTTMKAGSSGQDGNHLLFTALLYLITTNL